LVTEAGKIAQTVGLGIYAINDVVGGARAVLADVETNCTDVSECVDSESHSHINSGLFLASRSDHLAGRRKTRAATPQTVADASYIRNLVGPQRVLPIFTGDVGKQHVRSRILLFLGKFAQLIKCIFE
jgi:hypothetical protein